MAVAMRGVETQAPNEFLFYQVLEDDQTGVVLTYAAWFDRNTRKVYHTYETHWGRADGHANGIIRVTSA
jgi:hypothetical protein